ncbi:MAG TPA: hypothetical protein VIA62_06555 [Thermoanaerobaculia bacterium]|jgi:hypothetical protein|nr:hypothetical protein [Thermoanaerobaculia bacterium]
MRITLAAPLVASLLFSVPTTGWAGEVTPGDGTLLVHHRTGKVENATKRPDQKEFDLDSTAPHTVLLFPDEKVRVFVGDPNPFLFAYKLDSATQTPNADFEAAGKLADALGGIPDALGTLAGASKPGGTFSMAMAAPQLRAAFAPMLDEKGRPDASEIQDLRKRVQTLLTLATDPSEKTELSQIDLQLTKMNDRLQDKNKAVSDSELQAWRADIQDSLNIIAAKQAVGVALGKLDQNFWNKFVDSIKSLREKTAAIPQLIGRATGSPKQVEDLKAEVEGWNFADIEKTINDGYEKLDQAESEIQQALRKAPAFKFASIDSRLVALDAARGQKYQVDKAIGLVNEFIKTLNQVDKPLQIGDPVSYDHTKDTTFKFSITPSTERAKQVAATGRKTGTFTLVFKARSLAGLKFGAAAVYSFVKKPSFKTVAADGKFKIVEDDSEYSAQKVAAMLTIVPRSWSDPTFGGAIELGVNPGKDEVGLFLGGALRIQERIHFGAGFTYQQVPALKGQKPGDLLDKAEDLKVGREFKGGAYISLGISVKIN